jgi:glycosyltransferase involved in cell wall biosynthesis
MIFAPATAFPEGMAAVAYRLHHKKKLVMMDDAFERTVRCDFLPRLAKRAIHQNIDAVFIPAPSHQAYYFGLGFPSERIFYGVDVVDNDFFSLQEGPTADKQDVREALSLPDRYFLFVGRFLERKGIDLLVEAFRRYREVFGGRAWDLVLVGTGELPKIVAGCIGINGGIHLAGPRFGRDLCRLYSLARACIVPSHKDPWALVVNEAMASGLPVIVSRGCGAAKTLVREAENGWTFAPGDAEALKRLMTRMTLLEDSTLARMGRKSQEIISAWSLDRFVDGLLAAAAIPRRPAAGLLSEALIRVWKGRMRVN